MYVGTGARRESYTMYTVITSVYNGWFMSGDICVLKTRLLDDDFPACRPHRYYNIIIW